MANIFNDHNEKIVALLTEHPELIKNQEWRLSNLYWIITKDGDKQVFTMNRAQRHFYDTYINVPHPYHRHCILKSRQLGFTTFIDILILDYILFNPNKEGIIIAHKVEDATQIFDKKVEFAVRNMAEDVKGAFFKIQQKSSRKIQVTIDYGPDTGSTSSITVAISGRSGTYHYVHISEFAKMCAMFPKRAEEVERGTFPTVPFDGFIFIESTAEGMAGRFYEIFQQNWLNRDKITPQLSQVQFLPHFYNWQYDDMEMKKIYENVPTSQMEECEIDWASYQEEHKLTDKEITYYYMKWLQFGGKNSPDAIKSLMQEFPTTQEEAFLSTGQTYFSTAKVAELLKETKPGVKGELGYNEKGDVIVNQVSSGSLEVFKMPEVGTRYIIGGDTAEGLAHGDAQVLYVINHKTEECDAIYRSQVAPDELAAEAYKLGKLYNFALIGIEVNKDGLWVNDALEKMGYINLYYRKVFDDITQKVTKFFGWKTTSATRPFALAALKAVFFRKDRGFPAAILNEMFTFIRNTKGKPEAMDKKHDDCFVRNTMIATDKGNIPIQDIKVGDLVLTRAGYKPVINTRCKEKTVISNIGLKGTPDHPIMVVKQREKALSKIDQDDKLHIWNPTTKEILSLSYTEAKDIIESQTLKEDNIGSISGDTINGKKLQLPFTVKFGLTLMDLYQKVIRYTIKMATLLITRLLTLKWFLVRSTLPITYKNEGRIRRLPVNVAIRDLLITLLGKLDGVPIYATPETAVVYNLQVADCPEYFANGILVHNCIMAASIGYAILQEQGKYVEDTTGGEGFSHLRCVFGEEQGQINH